MRNAFDSLGTESTLRSLVNSIRELAQSMSFSRSVTDNSMRVTVQNAVANPVAYVLWGNSNTYPVYYSTGGVNSVDGREQQRELANQSFIMARNGRWTVT